MFVGPATFVVMLLVGLLLVAGALILRTGRHERETDESGRASPLGSTPGCAHCGHRNAPVAAFCASCGRRLGDGETP